MNNNQEEDIPELEVTEIHNRFIGVGLIPDMEAAEKVARQIQQRAEVSQEGELIYLTVPDLKTDVQTLRHQTLVRTRVEPENAQRAFSEVAELIDQITDAVKPNIVNMNDLTGWREDEDAEDRDRHPFDMGMNIFQAIIAGEIPNPDTNSVKHEDERRMVANEEHDIRFLCHTTCSTLGVGLNLDPGRVSVKATAFIPMGGFPTKLLLMSVYETLVQNARLKIFTRI